MYECVADSDGSGLMLKLVQPGNPSKMAFPNQRVTPLRPSKLITLPTLNAKISFQFCKLSTACINHTAVIQI